ncbi:MAG: hypothetical protein V1660_02475 [archaeon]
MNKQKISGYVMALVGFALILMNAISYVFDLDMKSSALSIIGIVFVAIGMRIIKKAKNNNQ